MVSKSVFVAALLALLCSLFAVCSASPYNRWGPGEGYGHTGDEMPPDNPNAAFGFDRAGILGDDTNYGRVFNRHRSRSGRRLPSSSFYHNRRSDSVTLDPGNDLSGAPAPFARGSIYAQGNRRPKPHQDFYAALEKLFGRFNTPRFIH